MSTRGVHPGLERIDISYPMGCGAARTRQTNGCPRHGCSHRKLLSPTTARLCGNVSVGRRIAAGSFGTTPSKKLSTISAPYLATSPSVVAPGDRDTVGELCDEVGCGVADVRMLESIGV